MPRDDRILNAISYVVVFLLGAVAGGVAGFYTALRFLVIESLAATLTLAAIGAVLGGIAALAFAAQSHWEPSLHLTRDRKDRRD